MLNMPWHRPSILVRQPFTLRPVSLQAGDHWLQVEDCIRSKIVDVSGQLVDLHHIDGLSHSTAVISDGIARGLSDIWYLPGRGSFRQDPEVGVDGLSSQNCMMSKVGRDLRVLQSFKSDIRQTFTPPQLPIWESGHQASASPTSM